MDMDEVDTDLMVALDFVHIAAILFDSLEKVEIMGDWYNLNQTA